jgi:hypothetical protein
VRPIERETFKKGKKSDASKEARKENNEKEVTNRRED